MKTILVPVDMTAAAVLLCETAAELASAMNARLLILHVVARPSVLTARRGESAGFESATVAAREQAKRRLIALGRWLEGRCPQATMMMCLGEPAARIVHTMKVVNPDYVVIGSHGHGAARDFVVGSTSQAVLRKAACPVVVVAVGKRPRRLRLHRVRVNRLTAPAGPALRLRPR